MDNSGLGLVEIIKAVGLLVAASTAASTAVVHFLLKWLSTKNGSDPAASIARLEATMADIAEILKNQSQTMTILVSMLGAAQKGIDSLVTSHAVVDSKGRPVWHGSFIGDMLEDIKNQNSQKIKMLEHLERLGEQQVKLLEGIPTKAKK